MIKTPIKKPKTPKFLKIFLEPLIRAPKTSHTTLFFWPILKFFWLLSAC
jgi:hypothetical protein